MVTAENNNKFYDMRESANGTFTVSYGRVGATSVTKEYPIAEWQSKFNEKIRKGYVDHTSMVVGGAADAEFAEIPDEAVRHLLDELMSSSRQSIFRNYNVAADQVTKLQVEKAQALLDQLVQQLRLGLDVAAFNERLLELYKVIPRKMKNVREHLVQSASTAAELEAIEQQLAEEQATLDVMRGQVEMVQEQLAQSPEKRLTVLEAIGMQVEPVNDADLVHQIKRLMGSQSGKFRRAYKVTNLRTQTLFDKYVATSKHPEVRLFWHGSRNENWFSILKTGLVLRPANAVITGKMFGYGLYFADKCRKSLNYTSLDGTFWAKGSEKKAWLALYDVHIGHPLVIKNHEAWCTQLTGERLQERGKDYDSVFAKGGADLVNNEYIVYNERQCTVRYFVEIGA
ncbi:MAG: WGR domain-containing protein [Saprospiraceae bacterium]|nr:WGR domain-containing protein [Saprospiraceae bacterium]